MSKTKKKKKSSTGKTSQQQNAPAPERSVTQREKIRQPVLTKRKQPNWPLTALAGAGMALTLYLTLTIWFGDGPLYCADGSACDIVQQSRWGTFLGMPTVFWGFLTYATLAYIGFKVRSPERHWKSAWFISLLGVSYSVYLTWVSRFVIGAFCPYCLISLSIMMIIFVTVNAQRPEEMKDFRFAVWAGKTAVVALIFVGGMHLYYSGELNPAAGPEDPYLQRLATHLAQENAVLYGAFW